MTKSPFEFDLQLFADGDEAPVTPATPATPASADAGAAAAAATAAASTPEEKTFAREYVEKLRRSNAELEKNYRELKVKQDTAEAKVLEDEKRFRELYEKSQSERDAEKRQFMDELTARDKRAVMGEVRAAATSSGIIDAADIKLLDMDNFKLEDDGTVAGLTEAMADLKKRKPYLFNDTKVTVDKANKEKAIAPADKGGDPEAKNWMTASDDDFKAAWGKFSSSSRV